MEKTWNSGEPGIVGLSKLFLEGFNEFNGNNLFA